jgi:hypothetical protein
LVDVFLIVPLPPNCISDVPEPGARASALASLNKDAGNDAKELSVAATPAPTVSVESASMTGLKSTSMSGVETKRSVKAVARAVAADTGAAAVSSAATISASRKTIHMHFKNPTIHRGYTASPRKGYTHHADSQSQSAR